MRITHLLLDMAGPHGLGHPLLSQATALAASGCHVEAVSLLDSRGAAAPAGLPTTVLCHARGAEVHRVDHRYADLEWVTRLHRRPSISAHSGWDALPSAACDALAAQALPKIDADVVVISDPGLLTVPELTGIDAVVAYQEHRSLGAGQLEVLAGLADRVDALTVGGADLLHPLRRRLGPAGPVTATLGDPVVPSYRPRPLGDQRVVLGIGAGAGNRVDHAIGALGRLGPRAADWRLRVLGAGRQRGVLNRETRRARLEDRVELLDVPTDLSGEWAAAGIGVLTSRFDVPPAFLEASEAGLPLVAYDGPSGIREIVRHRETGLLVPEGDVESLALAIGELIHDDGLRDRLGRAATEHVRRNRGLDAFVGHWLNVLEHARRSQRAGAGTGRVARLTSRVDGPASSTWAEPDPPMLTPCEAQAVLLRWLAAVSEQVAGNSWFVLPRGADGRPVVVLPARRRADFLAALDRTREDGTWPAWAGLSETPTVGDRPGVWRSEARSLLEGVTAVLAVGPPPPAWESKPHHLHEGAAVDVEFWATGLAGRLRAPRRNHVVDSLPPEPLRAPGRVVDVEIPVLGGLSRPDVETCDFPVDVVYTWVDGDDPTWRQRRDARAGRVGEVDPRAAAEARFRDRDELRYSLRSLHMFAPWVRRVHLVTDAQRPEWLVPDERLRVVDHREILPPNVLPTFNSHAIEAGLHRIPDLAEHFVYINDDVLLGRPAAPTTFFTPGGLPRVFLAPVPVGLDDAGAQLPHLQAGRNNRRLLEQHYGRTLTRTVAHTPHPHRTSVLAELHETFPAQLQATQASPFRSPTDHSLVSSLAQHVGLATGRAVTADHRGAYVSVDHPRLASLLESLLARDRDFLCLADPHDYTRPMDVTLDLMHQFLADYYPVPSPWEPAGAGSGPTTARE